MKTIAIIEDDQPIGDLLLDPAARQVTVGGRCCPSRRSWSRSAGTRRTAMVSGTPTRPFIGSAAFGEGLVNVYRGTGKVLLAPVSSAGRI